MFRYLSSWQSITLKSILWGCLIFLLAWPLLRFIGGELRWWLFVLNAFAHYRIIPLVVLLLIAMLRRSCWLGYGIALAMGLWALDYGRLFLPQFPHPLASRPTISLMTYNLMGLNRDGEAVIQNIEAADPDVVMLQELNPSIASAIESEFANRYPHQILAPQEGGDGLGIISRHTIRDTGETLPGIWTGTPQIVSLNLRGTEVLILNFHACASVTQELFAWTISCREHQAREVADFVARHPDPLAAGTDFNATAQSKAYDIVTEHLEDSWQESGWGFGHTFPGAKPYPQYMGLPSPSWLVRIDYIFHSEHWDAMSAEIGHWDGISDHRPVVVTLQLKEDN